MPTETKEGRRWHVTINGQATRWEPQPGGSMKADPQGQYLDYRDHVSELEEEKAESSRRREELQEVEAVAVRRYDESNKSEQRALAAEKALNEVRYAANALLAERRPTGRGSSVLYLPDNPVVRERLHDLRLAATKPKELEENADAR